ncbi:hypothetical protein APY94_03490 [Thermococcus celericrescens]|uniref:Uncharacterized protein n=1 Tax=Thermococcus celericrescens TaxID=227598 RepID=A0A100XYK1_9EURY|nr:hypothetical protein [Thermococcus celericrescens]KUH34048.1 hypothetical protein APY94_03490 [Thermococcus celericrescens]
MRRGQLFSMDALISIVLVIMILGTVSATSESLRSEIASMVGWYERANIADNMLDVLTKSPGEPENWHVSSQNIRMVGLQDSIEGYLDYTKLETLMSMVSSDNKSIINALCNLSSGNNFELATYLTEYTLEASLLRNVRGGLPGFITTCDPTELPTDSDVTAYCPSEEFEFQSSSGSPWANNQYANSGGSVCILNPVFIIGKGQNGVYQVTLSAGYFAVDGNLELTKWAQLSVSAGDVYVNGDLYIEIRGNPQASSIAVSGHSVYVNGTVQVYKGNLTINGGSLYIFNPDDSSPAISLGRGQGTSPGGDITADAVYIHFDGYWFAITGDPLEESSWHVNVNGDWVPIAQTDIWWYVWNDDVYINNAKIIDNADRLTINGGSLDQFDDGYSFEDVAPPCILYAGESGVELRISSINVTYQLPSFFDVSINGEEVAVINCTSVTDEKTIQGSKNSAPWIEYTERRVPTLKKVYSHKYTLTPDELPKEAYSGTIDQYTSGMVNITFPGGVDEGNLTLLSVFTTPDYTGHSIVAFFKTQDGWIYGANMTKIYPTYNISGTPENCEIEINNNYATMSLSCLVPPAELDKSVTFTVWAYSLEGFPEVTIEDIGNLDAYLKPVRQMGVIRLWVWPRR